MQFFIFSTNPTVKIDSSVCVHSAASSTEITCETSEHNGSVLAQVSEVQVGDNVYWTGGIITQFGKTFTSGRPRDFFVKPSCRERKYHFLIF